MSQQGLNGPTPDSPKRLLYLEKAATLRYLAACATSIETRLEFVSLAELYDRMAGAAADLSQLKNIQVENIQ